MTKEATRLDLTNIEINPDLIVLREQLASITTEIPDADFIEGTNEYALAEMIVANARSLVLKPELAELCLLKLFKQRIINSYPASARLDTKSCLGILPDHYFNLIDLASDGTSSSINTIALAVLAIALLKDINYVDNYDNNLVSLTIINKNIFLLELLILRGIDIHRCSTGNKTALHLAVESRCPEIVKLLLNAGVNVNKQNSIGETPLHKAVVLHKENIIAEDKPAILECLNVLLAANSDLSLMTYKNPIRSALKIAIENTDTPVVDCLLNYGAPIEPVFLRNEFFHNHIKQRNLAINITLLLIHKMDGNNLSSLPIEALFNIILFNGLEFTPSLAIIFMDAETTADYYISNYFSPSKNYKEAITEHEYVITNNSVLQEKIANLIFDPTLSYYLDINSFRNSIIDKSSTNQGLAMVYLQIYSQTNAVKQDPKLLGKILYALCKKGFDYQNQIIDHLLKHGADVNYRPEKQANNLLDLIITSKNYKTDDKIKFILLFKLYNLDIDYKDKNGNSPIITALYSNQLEIVKFIYDHFEVNDSYTKLLIAISRGYITEMESIIETQPELLKQLTPQNHTPLQFAMINTNTTSAKFLLKLNPELIYATDDLNQTWLHIAVKKDNIELVKLCLESGLKDELDINNRSAVFHIQSEATAKLLADAGCNFNPGVDIHGYDLIHRLYELYVHCTSDTSEYKDNPVLYMQLIKFCISQGTNLNNSLTVAPELNKLLVRVIGDHMHALTICNYMDDDNLVVILFKSGMQVGTNYKNIDQIVTLMHNCYSCADENVAAAITVCSSGSGYERFGAFYKKTKDKLIISETPFEVDKKLINKAMREAITAKDEKRAIELLKRLPKDEVNTQNCYGITLLHLAAYHGMQELACKLIDKGAHKDSRDAFGLTPKQAAAENKSKVKLSSKRGSSLGKMLRRN